MRRQSLRELSNDDDDAAAAAAAEDDEEEQEGEQAGEQAKSSQPSSPKRIRLQAQNVLGRHDSHMLPSLDVEKPGEHRAMLHLGYDTSRRLPCT